MNIPPKMIKGIQPMHLSDVLDAMRERNIDIDRVTRVENTGERIHITMEDEGLPRYAFWMQAMFEEQDVTEGTVTI